MRIPAPLLLISLLALVLYAHSAQPTPGQQPGTVNIRPRVTTNQPGMPEVKATADRNRVPLGDEVTFTLSPARVLTDPRYKVTLFFGDGGRQVMRQPQTVHPYKKAGTFTYSILVEPAAQQPKPSPKPTPTPTPAPALAIPNVKLSFTPPSVEVNRSVRFSAELSRSFPNLRYKFAFADGSNTVWQAESYATHAYRAPNTYRPYVEIGIFANGFVKQVGVSKRQSIVITKLNTDGNSNGNKNLNGNRNTNQPGNSNNRDGNTNRPDNSNQNRNPNVNTPSNMNDNSSTNVNRGGANSNINTNANTNSNTVGGGNVNGNASPTASATASETPLAIGPVVPTDWWKYLIIIAAIILFAAYKAASYIFVPRPTFVPGADPGEASVGGQNLGFDLQMDVDPNVDGGDFKIQTESDSLIKTERSAQ
jgi:PKD domain-containing protein